MQQDLENMLQLDLYNVPLGTRALRPNKLKPLLLCGSLDKCRPHWTLLHKLSYFHQTGQQALSILGGHICLKKCDQIEYKVKGCAKLQSRNKYTKLTRAFESESIPCTRVSTTNISPHHDVSCHDLSLQPAHGGTGLGNVYLWHQWPG